jgi:hypothetical protein
MTELRDPRNKLDFAMAFVPLPVAREADDELHAEQHAGYRLMDEMLVANDKDRTPRVAVEAFFALVERVTQNIEDAPNDPKFQRLKTASKGYAPVKNVKMGQRVMEYLGFRDRVEMMEHWSVLRTDEVDWRDGLRRRADLVKKEYEKRRAAEEHEARGAEAKAASDKRHKEALLARINEERKERKN